MKNVIQHVAEEIDLACLLPLCHEHEVVLEDRRRCYTRWEERASNTNILGLKREVISKK